MIKRPKCGESEDDLLKFQEEFFSSQQKPSVIVKKAKQTERDVVTIEDEVEKHVQPVRPPLQFPNDKMNRFTIRDVDMDARQRLDVKDKEHVEEILTNIQERDIEPFFNFNINCYKNGFPKVPKLSKDLITDSQITNTGKKKSLFAQQYSSFNEQKDFGKEVDTKTDSICSKKIIRKKDILADNDSLLSYTKATTLKDIVTSNDVEMFADYQGTSGSKVKTEENKSVYSDENPNKLSSIQDDVHQENVQRLNEMGEEEIMEEQRKLLNTLDPKVIEFMRTRRKVPQTSNDGCHSDLQQATSSKMDNSCKDDDDNLMDVSKKYNGNMLDVIKNEMEVHIKEKNEGNLGNIANKMEVANEEEQNMKSINGDGEEERKDEKNVIDPHQEFNIKKDYVNMNVVEKEKLAWMKDIPKIELKEGNAVPRFDFEGILIDPVSDIPISAGLHHHGDEPGLPGYTLEELFHLARSNFPQQRVFSLQLLGRIFDMYHQQQFAGKLTADLLTKCLDSGLIFILRWSLDEQAEQIYSAAVAAIANVIYVKNDQNLVENYLFSEDGHLTPSLCTYYKKTDEMTQAEKDEDKDLTDAQLVSLDLIKGMLQIQILPRLRYIIEMCNPSMPAVNNCLCILIRMTQHNAEVAHEIFKYNLLMPAVFKLLSSVGGECKQETKVYALQLIRCMCQASKSISREMVDTYKLHELISAQFSSKQSVALYSSGAMYIQVCHIWNILLRYGICSDLVSDLYPVIMSQLQQYSASYKNLGDKMLASLINIIDVSIACTCNGDVDWSLIEGLFPVVYHTLKVIQKDMFLERKVTHPYFISALLRWCGTYFQYKNTKLSDVNPVTLLDEVEKYWNEIIQPIVSSPLLHKLLDELRIYSDFKSFKGSTDPLPKNPENLPSYGSYCLSEHASPSLTNSSPMVIVQALLKLVLQLVQVNKVLIAKAIAVVIAPESMAYMKFLLESGNLKRCSMLVSTRVEVLLLSHLLKLFYLVGSAHGFLKFGQTALNAIQEMSFQLICYLQKDDVQIVDILMKNIIFNSKVFRKQDYVLWLSEYCENNLEVVVKGQLQTSRNNLQFIGSMYKGMLLTGERKRMGVEKSSLLMPSLQTKAVPSDWMFYPIVHFFNTSVNIEQAGGMISNASPEVLAKLKLCLEFILLVEVTRPALVANIPETIRFTRLICLFMTEGLLFNEKHIKDLVISIVAIYSSPSFQSYLNFEMDIPGITSFIDYYKNVVGMYMSTSFNDYGFANVLLFPIQLQHDVKYRLLIWTEFSDILRIFPVPLNQVICDIKKFLAVENEDIIMTRLYFQALIGGTVKDIWCPLFYLIAVHHVNHFIFSVPHEKAAGDTGNAEGVIDERSLMLNAVFASSNKEMKEDVMLYKCFDINRERGVSKFIRLPPSRELFIRRIKEKT